MCVGVNVCVCLFLNVHVDIYMHVRMIDCIGVFVCTRISVFVYM